MPERPKKITIIQRAVYLDMWHEAGAEATYNHLCRVLKIPNDITSRKIGEGQDDFGQARDILKMLNPKLFTWSDSCGAWPLEVTLLSDQIFAVDADILRRVFFPVRPHDGFVTGSSAFPTTHVSIR